MEAKKREKERYAVRGGAFAAFGKGLPKVGVLKDVSLGGLSFDYLYDNEAIPDADHVDIWTTDTQVFMRDLPCKKVYEITPSTEWDNPPFSATVMHRCGLQFGQLSTEQSATLSSFISACT